MPLPLCLILMAVGLYLSRRGRQSKCGRWLIISAFAWLLVASNGFFSKMLIYPLEYRYPAIPELSSTTAVPTDLTGCTAIVVLGSGHADSEDLPSSSKLSDAALGRIVEGVRISRFLPQATLITSGGPIETIPHGLVLSQSAQSMGIEAKRIHTLEAARDTHDEAQAVKQLGTHKKIALVTSASHMPRALALFRKEGLEVVPCPADFKGKGFPHSITDLTCNSYNLNHTTAALHEYIGYLWAMLRGQV